MAKMNWGINRFLLPLFVIFFALSCQKHESNEQIDQITNVEYATASASDVLSLKEWLNSKKSILTAKDQSRLDSLIESLNWKKTAIANTNNETLFIIPAKDLITDPNQTSFNLVIFKNSEGYYFSTLFRIKSKQLQRINNIDLISSLVSNKSNNYSCDIAAFTPSSYICYEYKFVDGQIKTRSKVSKRKPVTSSNGRTSECITWFWITYYNDGSWDWEFLGAYCYGGDPVCNETRIISRSQKINCNGGSGGFATEDQLIATFIARIENLLQHQCLIDVLNLLKALNNGKIAQIIQQFSGELPNWNWRLQEGTINGSALAETHHPPINGVVTTIFDYNKLDDATELSLARTMMHESIHAYLTSYFRNDPMAANKDYPQMLRDWNDEKYQYNLNTVQHNEIVRSFVGDIAASLKEFGISRGYNLTDQFYNDMAWGGLTATEAFEELDQADKDRISERLEAELTSQTVGNETPSNSKACN